MSIENLEKRFFREETDRGTVFVSNCDPKLSCPPAIIARIALGAYGEKGPVPGVEIAYPGRLNVDGLKALWYEVAHYTGPSVISPNRGAELAAIGKQLLELDGAEKIQPPLDEREKESIQYLMSVVATAQTAQNTAIHA